MPTGVYTRKSVAARFWEKVETAKVDDCWEWKASLKWNGYGSFYFNRTMEAHRVSWILSRGEVPDGLFVLHKCDNRKCVNPDHLFLGTNQDNMDDMIRKGRSVHAKGKDNPNSKLNEDEVRLIRKKYKSGNISQRKLAKEMNVSRSCIDGIVNNKRWVDLG